MEIISISKQKLMVNLKHEWKILIDLMIKRARQLNEMKDTSVSKPLPGTEFLHGMLKDKVFSNTLYKQLVRLAEDKDMKYEIIVK
jgi:hypothetical protein